MKFFNLFSKKQPKSKSGFFKPQVKVQMFRYPSMEAPEINQGELSRLVRNIEPDRANKILRHQARSISTAVSLASGFFDMIDSEVLGEQGFILDIATKSKDLNTKIQNAFWKWQEDCCIYGVYDFEDYEELTLNALYRDGEAFIRLVRGDTLKMELISAESIDNDYTDESKFIFYGIEKQSKFSLTPVRYFVKRDHNERIGIEAKDIIHIRKPMIAEQTRGNSKLATAIFDIHQKDKFKKAELNRARLASEMTGFYTQKDEGGIGGIAPEFDEDTGELTNESAKIDLPENVETGTMRYLDAGIEPKFVEPHNPTNIEFFLKSTNQEVARSLGISYATLTGDLREVNYSSIRQGTTSERRGFKRVQNFLRRKMHNAIFKEWLKIELLMNRISPKEYGEILDHFSFKPQGWEYIDPNKEVSANAKAIECGFKTRIEVLREKGIEYDTYLDELEKEKQIVQKLQEIEKIRKGNSGRE